ncbi:MAG TPA: penicillin-binding protein 2 [Agitococcus sp.]|nr:penicillin-binding protein 2 [Agitococcus sp.]
MQHRPSPTHPDPLKNNALEAKLFKRRVVFCGFFIFIAFFALILRYGYLQIFEYQTYTTLAQSNRIKLQAITPPRGYIYDRNGILLADNRPIFTAIINRQEVDDFDLTLKKITPIFQLDADDLQKIQTRFLRAHRFEPITVKLNLTEADIARFSEVSYLLKGVSIEVKLARYYPYGELFAHALGYVGRISDKEAARIDPERYAGTDLIGKTGIEKYYENLLQGKAGYQQVEANAHGEVLRLLERNEPIRGNDLVLHLDYGLQKMITEKLAGRRGAVVAIEPRTGGILAFVSTPSFDPNPFVSGVPNTLYQFWRNHPDIPLYNRASQGVYPPGSTIKPFAGMGGLNYKLVDWDFKIHDRGSFSIPGDNHLFRDWKKTGHGVVDLHRAVEISCDTYFYTLAYKMGVDKFHDWMAQFGFGAVTGIDLSGEKSGTLPSVAWKRKTLNAPWYTGEMISVGIGQGYFTSTPLQLAMATAIMANKGQHITPHLLKSTTGTQAYTVNNQSDGKVQFSGDEAQWDLMHKAMRDVVHGRGTAGNLRKDLVGYEMAGKTGTAQVKGIKQGQRYDEKSLDERHLDHAWFMGFAPVDNPQVAVAVLVENGKHGSSTAGPIAKAVFDYVIHQMNHDTLAPTNSTSNTNLNSPVTATPKPLTLETDNE